MLACTTIFRGYELADHGSYGLRAIPALTCASKEIADALQPAMLASHSCSAALLRST